MFASQQKCGISLNNTFPDLQAGGDCSSNLKLCFFPCVTARPLCHLYFLTAVVRSCIGLVRGLQAVGPRANRIDESEAVSAWVKNDHLGFEIMYVYRGVVRKYRPDFLIRLKNGDMLVLETKGQDTEQDQVKREYLEEWTQAVNTHGGFGRWCWVVGRHSGEIRDVLMQYDDARTKG